jgi:hypothetical protein
VLTTLLPDHPLAGELWQLPLPWDAPLRTPPADTATYSGAGAALGVDAPAVAPPILLSQGHSAPKRGKGSGEAVALAVDPTNGDAFASGGDDGAVRIW